MKYFLLILSFLFFRLGFAQNLVENYSFEEISNSNKVNNWNFEWFADVCSANSRQWEFNCYGCPVSKFGKNFLKFTVSNLESMYTIYSSRFEPWSSGYAKIKLKKSLEITKTYEIKLWVYFQKEQIKDTILPYHFGFCFFNKDFIKNRFWLRNTPFKVHDLAYDNWYEQTWYIKPTCELNYFIIGLFKDDTWPPKEITENQVIRFYVDNISIQEIKSKDERYINYCNLPEANLVENKSSFDNQEIFFNTNNATIEESYKPLLDSITKQARKNPKLVFEIAGYTDDDGSNHIELSKMRVDAIINYLNNKGIAKYRFIPKYMGNEQKSDGKEAIKIKNRKVTIKKSNTRLDQIFYNRALNETNLDSAFICLKKWYFLTNEKMRIFSIFDTRLDKYKASKKWEKFILDLKSPYSTYLKPEDAFKLDSMYVVDQKYRTTEIYIQDLGEIYPTADSLVFLFPKVTQAEELRHDSINYVWMTKYIEKNGWPNKSEVGERPSRAAFYIIDHNLDTNSLKKYVPIHEAKCREGEADWSDYVMMFDRMEKECGRLQHYCTQYMKDPTNPNRFILASYDSKEAVNERRKKLGLRPIKDFDISFSIKK